MSEPSLVGLHKRCLPRMISDSLVVIDGLGIGLGHLGRSGRCFAEGLLEIQVGDVGGSGAFRRRRRNRRTGFAGRRKAGRFEVARGGSSRKVLVVFSSRRRRRGARKACAGRAARLFFIELKCGDAMDGGRTMTTGPKYLLPKYEVPYLCDCRCRAQLSTSRAQQLGSAWTIGGVLARVLGRR